MERSRAMATVLATEVQQLRRKMASLAEAKSKRRRRLCLSRRLSSLGDRLQFIKLACMVVENQPADKNIRMGEDWLEDLRRAIPEADDLLEKINLRQLPRTTTTKASAICDFLLSIPMVLHFAAGCRLKRMAKALDGIERKARWFLDQVDAAAPEDIAMPATCYGRTQEKEEMITSMRAEYFAFIPIVGMAGSGKSTFARWVYYDGRCLESLFEARMILGREHSGGEAVSTRGGCYLPLAELRDARRLIQKSSLSQSEEGRFEAALKAISQSLRGLTFLVVLLDVNNFVGRDLFERLMEALWEANHEGRIAVIITTSYAELGSRIIKSWAGHCYNLGPLSEEDSLRLFAEHASAVHPPYFIERIPKAFSRGHPLTLVVLAKMIRYKSRLLPRKYGDDLPGLCADLKEMYEKLIRDDDEGKLRNCFALLSLFPDDDCCFYREELIDLWVAQGFISLDEDEADEYFEALVRAGALGLVDPQAHRYDDPESLPRKLAYKTRDLLAFFAQHVSSSSKDAHLALSPSSIYFTSERYPPPKCKHLSLVCRADVLVDLVSYIQKSRMMLLSTLLLLGLPSSNATRLDEDVEHDDDLNIFGLLRVLHVREMTVPPSLLRGVVEHSNLIYLNISQSDIEILPDSIGDLGNLKIFKLPGCEKLRRLPKSIGRLLRLQKLDLQGCALLAREPFDWVGKLVGLEHLNLSQIDFDSLPKSIGKLGNLKALTLTHCPRIQRLPRSATKLLRLEKLDVEGCIFLEELPQSTTSVKKNLKLLNTLHCPSLTRMPPGIGQLSSLRSLRRYTASDELGRSITELQPLANLEGALRLDNLNKLADPDIARQARLEEKEKLRALTLRREWPDLDVEADRSGETERQVGEGPKLDVEAAQQVVEALRPNPHLESLKLILYAAKHLPSWMMVEPAYLTSLLHIRLFNLKRCEALPPLGQLPLLKVMEISGMDAVTVLDDSFYGQTGRFHSLESLTLSQMRNLKRWLIPEREEVVFPSLTHLTFMHCPKLEAPNRSLPPITTLAVWLDNHMLYRSKAGLNCMAPNVKKLSISLCRDLQAASSTCQGFWGLTTLKKLAISACNNLTCLPEEEIKQLKNLLSLKIIGCSNINSLPNCLTDVTRVRWLSISACPQLRSIPQGSTGRYGLKIKVEGCPLLKYTGDISDPSEWRDSD